MEKLLQQREIFLEMDTDDIPFNKIEGEPYPGSNVEIFWESRECTDKGYTIVLPEQEFGEADVFIHIPFPDNSDGIGNAPEEHIHLGELLTNKRVLKVVFTGGFEF